MDYLLAKARAALLDPVLAPLRSTERIYWLYLATSLVLAFVVWRLGRSSPAAATSPGGARGFLGWVAPRSIYGHASTRADLLYFVVNRAFYGLFVVPWCIETGEIRRVASAWLDAGLPSLTVAAPPGLAKDLAFTAVTTVAFDFGLFLGHYLMHRVPFLWEFHRTHHSAEVLTPVTVYRQHPVDDVVSISISALAGGLAQGAFVHFLGGGPQWITIGGLNVLLFAFYVVGYNLRHSHVWLSYGHRVEKWLMSPAQHQIHHSVAPEHFDRNLGFTFAFWDRLVGTLHTTAPGAAPVAFGSGTGEDAEYRSLAGLYLRPFRQLAAKGTRLLAMSGRTRALLFGTMGVAFLLQVATQLPAPAHDGTVRLEDLTWPEVRARIDHGSTTVLVPVGGTEQGGPHLTLGKHNFIVAWTAEAIARELGDALVAPVIPISPAGGLDPPTEHMRKAGTITISEPVFEALLEETARSLAAHGFRAICFVGDHGWSQPGQGRVAAKLSAEWRARSVRVVQVSDYYDERNGQLAWLLSEGEPRAVIGGHAGVRDTSELLVVNPRAVRLEEIRRSGGSDFATSGVDGDPTRASPERGRHLLELKVAAAAAQIRIALATPMGLEPLVAPMTIAPATTAGVTSR